MPTAHRQPLLERAAALAVLRRELEAAAAGVGRVVVVEGEAGIGKTALLGALEDEARSVGVRLLSAAGHELERDLGFSVVRTLLGPVLHGAGAEREGRLAGAARAAEQVLAPAPGDLPLDAGSALHALFWLCRNLADEAPVVLCVDDAHWADEPSLRALLYLARRVDDLPLLLVVARRTDDGPAVLARVAERAAATVRPGPLSPAAIASLVGEHLAGEPDPGLVAACHRAAAGNPFLTHELLVALREEAPGADGTLAALERVRPAAVARWVERRLARLPPAARRVAEAVAVLPGGAVVRHAAAVAGLDLQAAGDAADVLARAGVLRAERPLEFRHPLVRTAVHDAMPPSARSTAHARAATILRADGVPAERVGAHLLHAEPAGERARVDVLIEAAGRALAAAAPEAAMAFCRRALAEPSAADQRWAVLHELGRAAVAVAWEDAPAVLAEAVAAAPDPVARGRSLLLWAHAWGVTGGDPGPLRTTIDEALAAVGRAEAPLAARLRLKRRLLLSEDELDEELEAQVAQVDEGTLEGRVTLVQWAWRRASAGRCAARDAATAVRRALAAGPVVDWEDPTTAHHYALAIDVLRLAGDVDEADDRLRAATRTAAAAGDDYVVSMGMAMAGDYALERGRLADAEAEASVGRELAERRGPRMLAVFQTSGVLAAVALERGDVEAALGALRCLDDPAAPPGLTRVAATAQAAALLAAGDVEAAASRALEHGRGPWAARVANPALDQWRSVAAEALARSGDAAAGRALALEQLEVAQRWGAPAALGEAHRVAGRHAAGRAEAEAHFRAATELLAPTHARLWLARALVDRGGHLRRVHRRTEARDVLRQALAEAHACGALALAARAEEELRAAGGKPRRLAQRGVDALTPSELRVCRLASEGLSNREIAQTLFVTLRTVEGHLTSAYAKLGIAGRPELGAALGG